MTQQICPQCRQANKLGDQFCSRCGRPLALVYTPERSRSAMTVGNGNMLPALSLRQVGGAVAVSLVALAAEVGLIWLRRRVRRLEQQVEKPLAIVPKAKAPAPQNTTIISRRVTQLWRRGRLSGQVVEHTVYEEFE